MEKAELILNWLRYDIDRAIHAAEGQNITALIWASGNEGLEVLLSLNVPGKNEGRFSKSFNLNKKDALNILNGMLDGFYGEAIASHLLTLLDHVIK